MKKENIGLVAILGGIAFIGFIWFKRNKPKLSEQQTADLNAKSNSIKAGAETIDKPFEYSQQTLNAQFIHNNPYSTSSPIDEAQQAQINQNVTQTIECSMGVLGSSGVNCTNYNSQLQQVFNPNGVNTSGCNPPKLLITNVKRFDVGFPNPSDKASGWNVYFDVCGANMDDLFPISYKITVIDSGGSQEIVKDKVNSTFGYVMGYLPRRPKSAVVTLSIKDNKGKSYIQTFNYKD